MNLINILSISSYSSLILCGVIIFVELCIFCYFTPNIIKFFKAKGRVDDSFYNEDIFVEKDTISSDNSSDTTLVEQYIADENDDIKPLVFEDTEWEKDELSDEEIKPLEFKEEEWKEDVYESKSRNATSLLLEIDPDFKLDEFYIQVFELYSDISNHYSDDDLKNITDKIGRELYIANVRRMDSLRKRNLRHVVEVDNFLNCQILASKIIDQDLYVKVELRISCYDYIEDKTSKKVLSGSRDKAMYCTYRMVLKRHINQLRVNNPGMNKDGLKPALKMGSSLNDKDWILEGNVIVKRKK